MAGHSQFKNIMHRKNAQDAKKAKRFTKLLREMTVAAQAGGTDVEANPRLRMALLNARQANIPKDTIARAMQTSTAEQYEMLLYEGFGPNGSAFIVEVLTNNRNRSACDMRTLFNKHGVHLADTRFLFYSVALISYVDHGLDQDSLFMTASDHGAVDIEEENGKYTVVSHREHFWALKEALEKELGPPFQAELTWRPHIPIVLTPDQKTTFDKLISALEDYDDTQNVWHNVLSRTL